MKMSLKNAAFTFLVAPALMLVGGHSANAQESSKPTQDKSKQSKSKDAKPIVGKDFSLDSKVDGDAFASNVAYRDSVQNFYRGVGFNQDLRLKLLNPAVADGLFKDKALYFTPNSGIELSYKKTGNKVVTGLQRYVGGLAMKDSTARFSIHQFERDLNHDGKFTAEDEKWGPDAKAWRYEVVGPNKSGGIVNTYTGVSWASLEFSNDQIIRKYEERNFKGEIIEHGEEVIRKKHTDQGDVLVYIMSDGSEKPVVNGHIGAREKFSALIDQGKKDIRANYVRMQNNDIPMYGWAKDAFGKVSEEAKVTPKVVPRTTPYFQAKRQQAITYTSLEDIATPVIKIDYKKMEKSAPYRDEVLQALFETPVEYFGKKNVRPAKETTITMSSDTVQHLIEYKIASKKAKQDTLGENVSYTTTRTIDVFYDKYNIGLPDKNTHKAGYAIEKESWRKDLVDGKNVSIAHISFDQDTVNFDVYRMSGDQMKLETKQTFFKDKNGDVFFRESDKDQPFKVEAKDKRKVTLEEIRDSYVDMFRRDKIPEPYKYYNPYKLPDKPKN